MARHRGHAALSLVLTATVLGACSAGANPTASVTTSAAASAAATASASGTSTPEATSTAGGGAFHEGPLAAGTYVVGSAPAIGFTLGDGWSTDATDPGAFDVIKSPAWMGMGTITKVFTSGQDSTDVGTDPAAAAQLFAGNPALKVTAPQATIVGGRDGVWFDVTSAGDAPVFGFLTGGGRTYRFPPDLKDRVYLVADGDAMVVVTVEAPTDQFDAALAIAQPVLDSVTLK